MLTLSPEELCEVTGGYTRQADQLRVLHEMGFVRAWRGRMGQVIVERSHYESIRDGGKATAPTDYTKIIPRQAFHASSARRAAALAQRMPAWRDQTAIDAIYSEARRITAETGVLYHVDHEIPLQGELVSGLHVHNNLRVMLGDDNLRKGHRFEVA